MIVRSVLDVKFSIRSRSFLLHFHPILPLSRDGLCGGDRILGAHWAQCTSVRSLQTWFTLSVVSQGKLCFHILKHRAALVDVMVVCLASQCDLVGTG